MGIVVFSLAALLSMPKQFIIVYLGVMLEQSATGEECPRGELLHVLTNCLGAKDTNSRIIRDVVLTFTILITAVAMWYILREMNRVKPHVIYERRKAR
jgi:hypothetical protein